jgi:5-methylcytosine-specific restriction protein B
MEINKITKFFERINTQISEDEKLGRHYQVGHSYFMTKDKLDEQGLNRIWKYAIKPILEEYYFEDPEKIEAFKESLEKLVKVA